ncbi:hypothetical protein GOP47_0021413 [Adiantum capillus-veneris]|uniref:Uncharacterized protein n=1 Tax=Adiantum capillus-veneris TaxID=13818 RepID=A0A9D4U9J4_ADICA|nr:hypothetical protein GOP47_0021413 [Adiantum capillus-veneris]
MHWANAFMPSVLAIANMPCEGGHILHHSSDGDQGCGVACNKDVAVAEDVAGVLELEEGAKARLS